jgi:ABC-2 type transport system permease protein
VHPPGVEPILEIQGLCKTYAGGLVALQPTDLAIRKGEIFALLGPNGAGKTTLIGLVCGLVRPTGGSVRAFGEDMGRNWRSARRRIGLVPQELDVDMFEQVGRAVAYSRALFGRPPDPGKVEALLRSLLLWDKRESRIQALSGGMKRRVLIAKALAHEPDILFLDEPTAGVDVELRRDMWRLIGEMRDQGVTVILTTHYIEEAEEMADRIGVIDKGDLKLVEDKNALMARLGRTEAQIALASRLDGLPPSRSRRRSAGRGNRAAAQGAHGRRDRLHRCERARIEPRGHLRRSHRRALAQRGGHARMTGLNWRGMAVIYRFELARTWRTLFESIAAPVLTTSLYFVVFGSALGGQMGATGGVSYGAFIVPGLLMLTILSESTANASFGIYLPRFTGTIYELLSAPVGVPETLIGYVGAAATKSLVLAAIILVTARFFVDYTIAHPLLAAGYIVLIALAFSLFGFILGCWADGFEKLQVVPMLVLTPLTFLGGTFYSIQMLGEPWRSITLANPIVYLVNGLRWTFYGEADVSFALSAGLTLGFLVLCIAVVAWIFKTGWRLRP